MEYSTDIEHHDDVEEHPKNYREHPDDQIEHIKESLSDVGFYKNILVSSDGYILAGHGVTKSTKALEGELDDRIEEAEADDDEELADKIRLVNSGHLPVVRIPYEHDHPKALKRLTGDNELRHIGMQNDTKLIELLDEIKESEEELLGTGFDDQKLNNLEMINQPDDRVEDIDHDEHWQGMPEYGNKDGDTYKLNISFRNLPDREEFIHEVSELLDIEPDEKNTQSAWYPPKKTNKRSNLRFEPAEDEDGADEEDVPTDEDVLTDAAEPIQQG